MMRGVVCSSVYRRKVAFSWALKNVLNDSTWTFSQHLFCVMFLAVFFVCFAAGNNSRNGYLFFFKISAVH